MTSESSHPTSLTRRRFCSSLIAGASVLATAPKAFSIQKTEFDFRDIRKLKIRHARTDEVFEGVYYEYGEYLPDAMRQIDYILRDYTQDEFLPMDVRLIDMLARTTHELDDTELLITSGYRTRRTNIRIYQETGRASLQSLHLQGMAADFWTPKHSMKTTGRLLKSFQMGGVGIYPGHNFVHGDVGPVRSWIR